MYILQLFSIFYYNYLVSLDTYSNIDLCFLNKNEIKSIFSITNIKWMQLCKLCKKELIKDYDKSRFDKKKSCYVPTYF